MFYYTVIHVIFFWTVVLQAEHYAGTYVIFVTLHVVCEGSAAELIGTEEAKVTRDLSGYGGGQALEETLWSLIPHDWFHYGPHCASGRAERGTAESVLTHAHILSVNVDKCFKKKTKETKICETKYLIFVKLNL